MDNRNPVIETKPVLDEKLALNYNKSMTPEQKVNYLVQHLRLTLNNHTFLSDNTGSYGLKYKRFPFIKNKYDIEKDDFGRESEAVVDLLRRLNWEKEGIVFEKYDLKNLADFYQKDQKEIKDLLRKNTHSISIVTIGEKKYIIDCAYRQFFSEEDKIIPEGQIDLSELCVNDEERKKLAEQVLKYGWIEATPENIKRYMDMFIECTTKSKTINFPAKEDYEKNIKGEIVRGDEVIKEVSKECHFTKRLRLHYLQKKRQEENEKKRKQFGNVIGTSVFSMHDIAFCLIEKNGKTYIKSEKLYKCNVREEKLDEETRTKVWDIIQKAENGELEYTAENLKMYLDFFTIAVSGEKNVETPTVEEYNKILELSMLERGRSVGENYIIESEPLIIEDYDCQEFDENMLAEEKLTNIVQKERRFIGKNKNIYVENLAGDCVESMARVSFDCASKGFTDIMHLFPGRYLDKGAVGHNCTIATLNGKSYLIDCTYRQFFRMQNKEGNPRNIYARK